MLIIAGSIKVSPAQRDAYVAACVPIVEAARGYDGCSAFSISADTVESDRVLIFERWETEQQLLAFRDTGPTDDQQAAILDADVSRYTISTVGPP